MDRLIDGQQLHEMRTRDVKQQVETYLAAMRTYHANILSTLDGILAESKNMAVSEENHFDAIQASLNRTKSQESVDSGRNTDTDSETNPEHPFDTPKPSSHSSSPYMAPMRPQDQPLFNIINVPAIPEIQSPTRTPQKLPSEDFSSISLN